MWIFGWLLRNLVRVVRFRLQMGVIGAVLLVNLARRLDVLALDHDFLAVALVVQDDPDHLRLCPSKRLKKRGKPNNLQLLCQIFSGRISLKH